MVKERSFNEEFGKILRTKDSWQVRVQDRGVIRGEEPDILIDHPDRLPVIVETEYIPAYDVEEEARNRLGKTLKSGACIKRSIALRIPERLSKVNQGNLPRSIMVEDGFEFCVFSEAGNGPDRWPGSGWIRGGVDELAECVFVVALEEGALTLDEWFESSTTANLTR